MVRPPGRKAGHPGEILSAAGRDDLRDAEVGEVVHGDDERAGRQDWDDVHGAVKNVDAEAECLRRQEGLLPSRAQGGPLEQLPDPIADPRGDRRVHPRVPRTGGCADQQLIVVCHHMRQRQQQSLDIPAYAALTVSRFG